MSGSIFREDYRKKYEEEYQERTKLMKDMALILRTSEELQTQYKLNLEQLNEKDQEVGRLLIIR